jgi:hypothetical protein
LFLTIQLNHFGNKKISKLSTFNIQLSTFNFQLRSSAIPIKKKPKPPSFGKPFDKPFDPPAGGIRASSG